MRALLRYPWHLRKAKAREWAARSQAVQAAARRSRPVDADTDRRRALDDARGQVLREGVTYRASGSLCWQVRRALAGRTNQVEIVVAGRVWRRCSERQSARWLKQG